MEKCDLKLLI